MKKESGITPAALLRRPVPKPQDATYMRVFGELNGSRPGGDAFGNIPQQAYESWFNTWEVTNLAEKDRIFMYVKRMDDAFVKHVLEKRAAAMERAKKA